MLEPMKLQNACNVIRPFEDQCSLVPVPRPHRKGAHWVRPELVVEVAYSEMTADQQLRHARFKGIREDKPPRTVTVE